MSSPPRVKTNALTQNEEYCSLAIFHPVTKHFDHSETSAMIFQDESGDMDTEPSYSCDAELDDELIGKALSSPLFIQEREEPANRRQPYHSHEESLLPAQSFSAHTSAGRPCTNLVHAKNENQVAKWKMKESGFSLKDKKSKFSLKSEPRSRSTNFKPILYELNGIIESQRREIDRTLAGDEQLRRDQLLLQEQLSEQNRDLPEAHIKSLHEIEELKRVQELRVDESSRRRLIENQDTINELTARIQELQNDVNCISDSRDFKDAESVRSGLSHVPSQPALLPPYRDPGGMLSRPGGMLSCNDKSPDIWGTHGISGNVLL